MLTAFSFFPGILSGLPCFAPPQGTILGGTDSAHDPTFAAFALPSRLRKSCDPRVDASASRTKVASSISAEQSLGPHLSLSPTTRLSALSIRTLLALFLDVRLALVSSEFTLFRQPIATSSGVKCLLANS